MMIATMGTQLSSEAPAPAASQREPVVKMGVNQVVAMLNHADERLGKIERSMGKQADHGALMASATAKTMLISDTITQFANKLEALEKRLDATTTAVDRLSNLAPLDSSKVATSVVDELATRLATQAPPKGLNSNLTMAETPVNASQMRRKRVDS